MEAFEGDGADLLDVGDVLHRQLGPGADEDLVRLGLVAEAGRQVDESTD
jgi:hypothetical protein